MQTKTKLSMALATLVVGAMAVAGGDVIAADHLDADGAGGDPPADITDFYAWSADGQVTAIVAFAGLAAAGSEATYDSGVLYGFHVDNDGDGVSDRDVWARFGQDADGAWGLQVTGLSEEAMVSPVDEVLEAGDARTFSGARDDAFFFDLEGFGATLMEGTLMFDSTRDSFAGTNVTTIAIEAPVATFTDDEAPFTMWATSRRAQ